MTVAQTNEMLSLWDGADDKGKELMLDIIEQAMTFGDEWFAEMEIYLNNNDKIGLKEAVQRWKERI
jgi:hypothetical protein